MGLPVVFLDKDGTLVRNVPYNVDPTQIVLVEGAAEGLRLLNRAGYRLAIVSNQAGVARGLFTESELKPVERRMQRLLSDSGSSLAGFFYCPHHPNGAIAAYATFCECRKPAPGLILRAARELDAKVSDCWMVGDILDDVEAGCRAGCRTVLIDNGGETEWQSGPCRTPDFRVKNMVQAAYAIINLASPIAANGQSE
jgi:D-glycero-D-manno-heptose 1,7-bisphosphate phosphatase